MLHSAYEVCKFLYEQLQCYSLQTHLGEVRLGVAKHEGVSKEDAPLFRF